MLSKNKRLTSPVASKALGHCIEDLESLILDSHCAQITLGQRPKRSKRSVAPADSGSAFWCVH
jgi:hypothetical protein